MKLLTELTEEFEYISEAIEGSAEKKHFIQGPFLVSEEINGNKRLYPKAIMEKEVNRYINEKIDKRCAWGELGHPCFSGTAEALTITGWKYIKDIKEGEHVFTLNMDTKRIEILPNKKTNVNHYEGDMIKLYSRAFNTTVTPYHRFVITERNGNTKLVTAEEIEWGLNNNISSMAHAAIPKNGLFEGETTDFVNIGDYKIPTKIYAGFLGIYLSEGHTAQGSTNSFTVNIYQNSGNKADKIRNLLKELEDASGIVWKEREKNKKIVFSTSARGFGKHLHDIGICYNKYIPKDILNILDKEQSKALLDFFIIGDGRGNLDDNSKTDLFSTSYKLIDDLSVLATKAGYGYRVHTLSEFEDYDFAGRRILAKNKNPIHFLQILKTDNIYLDSRFVKSERISYNDDVYCLTTDNNTFLARDNGYCFWSGNCTGPKINEDRISHRITELKQDGNRFIGKALITETPSGSIIKGLLASGGAVGVSSRGLGSLVPDRSRGCMVVQEDFYLATAADVVTSPSGPGCWVDSVMENCDWVYDEKLGWKTLEFVEESKKHFHKNYKNINEEQMLSSFTNFMKLVGM